MKKDIEFSSPKRKRKIFKWILLCVFIIILIWIVISFINKQIMKENDKKIITVISELEKEKVTYVFVEINPSLVLTVKNDKVVDFACLNNDCMPLLKEMTVTGSRNEINQFIEDIYNNSKEMGFDTSKGVRIKTNGNIMITFQFAVVETIDEEEQSELLSQVIDNEQIKENNENDNYYTKLWNELKKDKDYGKIYDCKMNNNELECYIKNNLLVGFTIDDKDLAKYLPRFYEVFPNLEGIGRVLNKFGFETKGYTELGIFQNPIYYMYYDEIEFRISCGDNCISDNVKYSGVKECSWRDFNLSDLNLLKPNSIKEKYIWDDMKFEEESVGTSEQCGNWLCKIEKTTNINSCNYETNIINQSIDFYSTYHICDTNKANCKEVSKNEFDSTITGSKICDTDGNCRDVSKEEYESGQY